MRTKPKRILALLILAAMAVSWIPVLAYDSEAASVMEADVGMESTGESDALDVEIKAPDEPEPLDVDLSSGRILVDSGDATIVPEDAPVLGEHDGIYLLQYDTVEQAEDAYREFSESAKSVEADIPFSLANEEETPVAEEEAMTETENPIAILEQQIEEAEPVDDPKVIALIDSGTILSDNVIARYSVIDDDPADCMGHGSKMLETIVAQNPKAQVISIKAFDENGKGTVSSVYAAIQLAVELNADFINLSAYAKITEESAVISNAVRDAVAKGITFVGAAGNDSADVKEYIPGSISEATIVGAADEDGNRASFSNYGDTVDYWKTAESTSVATAMMTGILSRDEDEADPEPEPVETPGPTASPEPSVAPEPTTAPVDEEEPPETKPITPSDVLEPGEVLNPKQDDPTVGDNPGELLQSSDFKLAASSIPDEMMDNWVLDFMQSVGFDVAAMKQDGNLYVMSSNADYVTAKGRSYMANSPLFPGVGWNGRWNSPCWGGLSRAYAYWAVDNDQLMAHYLGSQPHTYENALKILHNDKYSSYYTTSAGVQCAGLVNFAYLEFLRFHASEYGIDPNLYKEIQNAIINYDYDSINRDHPEYGLTSSHINLNNTCTIGAWTDTLCKAGKMVQYHPTGDETWRDYVDYLGVGDIILFTGKSYLDAGYDTTYPWPEHAAIYIGEANGKHWIAHNDTSHTVDGYHLNARIQALEDITAKSSIPNHFFSWPRNGSAKLVKKVSDSSVSVAGWEFTFKPSGGGQAITKTTDKDGIISISGLKPGTTYTVTEKAYPGYVTPKAQAVKIESGKTNTVTFTNTPLKGNLTVNKAVNYGTKAGFKFHLKGTSTIGKKVDLTATTDSSGVAKFTGVYVGTYTLSEDDPGEAYVKMPDQQVTISADQTTGTAYTQAVRADNVWKYWYASITKVDAETGKSSSAMDGAEYTLYQNGKAVKVYTIKNGKFTTDEYPCTESDSVYTLKETKAPEGYSLNSTTYKLTSSYTHYTNKVNSFNVTVEDAAVKGKFQIEKWAVNTVSKDKKPEKGATFEVYLKSAGSYAKADAAHRDMITIGADGKGTSKDLPYGVYCIRQKTGWAGYELDSKVYEATIAENGATVTKDNSKKDMKFQNEIWTGTLTIVKVDKDSRTPLAGAEFELKGSDGSKQTATTGANGKVEFKDLVYGVTYEWQETKAPHGYVLDTGNKGIWSVEAKDATIEVTAEDVRRPGTIIVTKQDTNGEPLSGAVFKLEYKDGSTWTPVSGRKGDPITRGGCTSSGLVEGQLTTGDSGSVSFEGLWADGEIQYRLTEVKAPEGYELLKEPVYEGTLPVAVELRKATGDPDEVDGNTAYFYTLPLTVKDGKVFNLPHTGGPGSTAKMALTIIAFGMGLIAFTLKPHGFRRTRRSKSH